YGVERREEHGLGRVVDYQVDAGEGLERPYVATFATDDAALHGVVGDGDDRDADGGRDLGCAALYRLREDVGGAALGLRVGALQSGPDADRLLTLELPLYALQDHLRRLLAGELCHLV